MQPPLSPDLHPSAGEGAEETLRPFALSTAWNGRRHALIAAALHEVRALGFRQAELYAHFSATQVREFSRVAAEAGLAISSLHAPCPLPTDPFGTPRWGDALADPDERVRRAAVDAVRRTIDAAVELGARAVVVHLGTTGAFSRQAELFELVRAGRAGTPEHRALIERAWAERERVKGRPFAAALRSARELGEHARGSGVWIGLECRDNYVEIPSLDEFAAVFAACADLPVGYWHDAGHGQKLENAGLLDHEEYLRRYGARLVGLHLHDTRLDRDHQAPGQGQTDFARIARYDRPGLVRTLELSASVPRAQIVPAARLLAAAGFGSSELAAQRGG